MWCCSECFVSSGLDNPLVAPFCAFLFIQLFASRASNCCKHDMGTLLWLKAETLKRVPTPLFSRLVRCSPNGCSFTRLWYMLVNCLPQQGLFSKEISLFQFSYCDFWAVWCVTTCHFHLKQGVNTQTPLIICTCQQIAATGLYLFTGTSWLTHSRFFLGYIVTQERIRMAE